MNRRKLLAARVVLSLSAIACGLFVLRSARGQGFGGTLRSHDHSTTSQGGALGNVNATSATVTGRVRVSSGAIVNDGVQPGLKVGGGVVDTSRLVDISTGTTALLVVGAGQGVAVSTQVTVVSSLTVTGAASLATTSGSVGVGTANPGTRLHMSSGTLTIDGTSPRIRIGDNAADGAQPINIANNARILARNAANNDDVAIAYINTGNTVILGDANTAGVGWAAGAVRPESDNALDLGTAGFRPRYGYFGTGLSINRAFVPGTAIHLSSGTLTVDGTAAAANVRGTLQAQAVVAANSQQSYSGTVPGFVLDFNGSIGNAGASSMQIAATSRDGDAVGQTTGCFGVLVSNATGELQWTSTTTAGAAGIPAVLMTTRANGSTCAPNTACLFTYAGATQARVVTGTAANALLQTSATRCQGQSGASNNNCRTLTAEATNLSYVFCGVP